MQPRVKALILGALPCCLAADLPPAAITRTILPQADAPAPGSIVTLAKGDTVLAAKPGWLVAARLKQTIDAETAVFDESKALDFIHPDLTLFWKDLTVR